jgi:hypothetical protein
LGPYRCSLCPYPFTFANNLHSLLLAGCGLACSSGLEGWEKGFHPISALHVTPPRYVFVKRSSTAECRCLALDNILISLSKTLSCFSILSTPSFEGWTRAFLWFGLGFTGTLSFHIALFTVLCCISLKTLSCMSHIVQITKLLACSCGMWRGFSYLSDGKFCYWPMCQKPRCYVVHLLWRWVVGNDLDQEIP